MSPFTTTAANDQAQKTITQRISSWFTPIRALVNTGSSYTPITRLFASVPPSTLVLITGLDDAGKTTLLRHLAPRPESIQTIALGIGIQIEEVHAGPAIFQAYDIGGCRPHSHHRFDENLFSNAGAVVYMVDASDRDRIVEAREELMMYGLLAARGGMGKEVPLLILATKSELENARRPDQIETYFVDNISTSIGERPCHVAGINALTGEGISEAFSWLSNALVRKVAQETLSVRETVEDEKLKIAEKTENREDRKDYL